MERPLEFIEWEKAEHKQNENWKDKYVDSAVIHANEISS